MDEPTLLAIYDMSHRLRLHASEGLRVTSRELDLDHSPLEMTHELRTETELEAPRDVGRCFVISGDVLVVITK